MIHFCAVPQCPTSSQCNSACTYGYKSWFYFSLGKTKFLHPWAVSTGTLQSRCHLKSHEVSILERQLWEFVWSEMPITRGMLYFKKKIICLLFFFQKLTSSKAWKSTASNQHQTLGRGFIEPELLQRFRHLHLIPLTEIQALKPVISEQLLPRMEFVWYQHIYLFRPNSHFTWKTRCVIQMADLSQTYI